MERLWAVLWGCWGRNVFPECKCIQEGDSCMPGMCQCLDNLVTGELYNSYRPLNTANGMRR